MDSTEYGYEDLSLIINEGKGRQSVKRWQANVSWVLGFLLMFGVRVALTMYGKPNFVKQNVDFWKWRNIFISWFHGLIVGTLVLLCIWWYPEFLQDPVFYLNDCVYLIVPFSVGYFTYDLFDTITARKGREHWQTVLHHAFLIIGMMWCCNVKLCVGYCMIALTAEINSMFLHLRKLLQFADVGFNSVLYRVVSFFNLWTFLLFRLISHGRCLYGIFTDYNRGPVAFTVAMFILFIPGYIINFGLFWLVFKSDVIRTFRKKDKKC